MALVNKATNEITVKLVYYGPGLCGKTTNLEKIYGNEKIDNKGKMISMATETDRTLFFDFMPMELGTIGGRKVRVTLYTVPGQVFYDATRKLVLRGADGVVFVADSQESVKESNLESLENLYTNLRVNGLDPEKIALTFQLNKRDLPDISSADEMKEYLDTGDHPVIEASALNGQGVVETLKKSIAQILKNLNEGVDYKLSEPETQAASAAPQPTPQSAPAAAATSEDQAPFAAPSEAQAQPAEEHSPFASAATPVDGSDQREAELQALRVRTQELIHSLETALEIARSQDERIATLLRD